MKNFFTFIFILAIPAYSYSQSEIGILAGGSLFKGDVNRFFSSRETKPALGVSYRIFVARKISLRTNFTFTTLSGNDYEDESFSDNDIRFKLRNLHFRSKVLELNLVSEYFFFSLAEKQSTPYLFIGAGVFHFNPQAKYQGKWYDLQPLKTEGISYSKTNVNIVVGTGWKYRISNRSFLSFEISYRKTFTDYIDDVSGFYLDKGLLYQQSGSLSALLSDRSGDLVDDLSPFVAQQGGAIPDPYSESGYRISGYGTHGDVRGNPKNKDNYLIYNFSFTTVLGKAE